MELDHLADLLKNIWADKRSWDDGMTAFFAVHLVLTVVSLALGTIIGVLGIRALRRSEALHRDASENRRLESAGS